jgi:hypothetical protein
MKHFGGLVFIFFTFALCADGLLTCDDFTSTQPGKWESVGEAFPVNPKQMYRLSGEVSGNDASKMRVSMSFFAEDGAEIRSFWLNAVAGTETEMIEDCTGGNTLFVKDASKWVQPSKAPIVVFHAKPDLSDLPNRRIAYYVKTITKEADGRWALTFDRPLRKYPRGTVIRQHEDGGNMGFGVPNVPVTASWEKLNLLAFPAKESGAYFNSMWRGAVKAQIKLLADKAVALRNLKLEAVSEDEMKALLSKRTLRGAEVKNKVKISGNVETLPAKDAFEVTTDGSTAYHQDGLNWNIEEIKQIDISFMSTTPGYVGFACIVNHNGTRKAVGGGPFAVTPDGEYHHYVYDISESKYRVGTVSNWEIRFTGDPGKIGLKAISTTGVNNRIPDATTLVAGETRELALLMPRAKCVMFWEGGASGSATLRFYDHNMQEIGGTAVNLAAGQKQVEFTTPEMLINTTVTLNTPGDGMPVVRQLFYQKPYSSAALQWRGKWIWFRLEEGPDFYSVWFRKVIELDEAPEFAAIAVEADDRAYTYVNGRFMGKTPAWKIPGRYEITDVLKKGRNEICIRVHNDNKQSGLVADIYVKKTDGEIFLATDETWECDAQSNMDTGIPKVYPDKSVVLGNPATLQPWANGMGFAYAGPVGWFTPVKFEPGRLTVKVERMPAVKKSRMKFKMVKENGEESNFEVNVTPASDKWEVGQVCTIEYPMPRVEDSGFKLYLADDFVSIAGNPAIADIPRVKRQSTSLRQAKLVQGNGRPYLQLGDQKVNGTFWQVPTSYRVNHEPEWEITKQLGLKNLRVTTGFGAFWKGNGIYDFSAIDNVIDRMLSFTPDAVFALLFKLDMPEWWLAEHPDDTAVHCNGGPRDFLEGDDQAIGSKRWIEEGSVALKAFIDHIRQRSYAGQVWGISFGVGSNSEWFWKLTDAKGKLDWAGYSKADQQKFRSVLREIYGTDEALAKAWNVPGLTFDTAELPHFERAYKGSVGVLFDPAKDQQVMDWLKSRTRSMSDALIGFGKCVKEATDGKWLVGAYYGYSCEFATSSSPQLIGHNGYVDAASSPYVDFVHAPSRYLNRRTGLSEQSMQTIDTWLLRGKMIYTELDSRTAYGSIEVGANKFYAGSPDTGLQSVGQLNRGFGMMLATGTLNYWYDITCGSLYENAINRIVKEQIDVRDALPPVKNLTPAEVAVVFDRDSVYYTKVGGKDSIWAASHYGIFRYFQCTAVPFRDMSKQDLLDKSIKVPAHKCYIMLPTLVLTKDERSELMARFEREGASVIWLYAAGAFYPGNGPSGDNCCDFLGIKTRMTQSLWQPAMKTTEEFGGIDCVNYNESAPWFIPVSGYDKVVGTDDQGQALMVSKKIGKATHYFTTLRNLPVEFYAAIFPKMGVHRYMTEINDPCWIGNDVIFLHAATGGEKRFNLPKGCKAEGIIGPYRGTLEDGDSFNAISGLTYGFLIKK